MIERLLTVNPFEVGSNSCWELAGLRARGDAKPGSHEKHGCAEGVLCSEKTPAHPRGCCCPSVPKAATNAAAGGVSGGGDGDGGETIKLGEASLPEPAGLTVRGQGGAQMPLAGAVQLRRWLV